MPSPPSKAQGPQGSRSILSEPPPGREDTDAERRALLAELVVGAVIDGKYRIDEVLGRGAMGVVVSATHQRLGERVAIKFLRTRTQAGDDFQSRFEREAKVCAKLRNEHIARVIDAGLWRDHVPYMVMDYLQGTDLRSLLKPEAPLPVDVALEYAIQICEGIAEAHANGIIHRDLKPPNLFITKRVDGSDLVKILDFGISKWTAREDEVNDLTETGVVLGSPRYMSPEQIFGASNVDARADVWSIGAIVYEMLGGRPAFDFPTFSRICAELSTDRMPPSLSRRRQDVSPELDAAVMRCFARAPEDRHQDVAALAGALLTAVHAPFAEATMRRIAATLGVRTGRESTSNPGGPLSMSAAISGRRTTSSQTLSAMTPLTMAAVSVTAAVPGAPEAAPAGAAIASLVPTTEATSRATPHALRLRAEPRRIVWAIATAAFLASLAGIVWLLQSRDPRKAEAPPVSAQPPAASPAGPPATPYPPAAAALPSATSAAAASRTAESVTPPASVTTAAAAPVIAPSADARPASGPGHGTRPLPRATAGTNPAPTSATPATAAVPPTPVASAPATAAPLAPAGSPAPTPTRAPQSDPLGDRQ